MPGVRELMELGVDPAGELDESLESRPVARAESVDHDFIASRKFAERAEHGRRGAAQVASILAGGLRGM
jgi:hypothetical protein